MSRPFGRSGDRRIPFVEDVVRRFMEKLGDGPLVLLEENDPLLD